MPSRAKPPQTERLVWIHEATILEYFSIVWMTAEGAASVWAGMVFILLVSLLLQRQGLWWADPAGSAVLGIFIAREGLEAWERARR